MRDEDYKEKEHQEEQHEEQEKDEAGADQRPPAEKHDAREERAEEQGEGEEPETLRVIPPEKDEDAEELPRLEMSDELRAALDEAESAVTVGQDKRDEPGEQAPEKMEEPEEEEEQDPPSDKELELKMQVLEHRQQLRDKDSEIEQRVKELKQNLGHAKHIQSQFESYKARMQKEKADWFNYGNESLLKELLVVIDSLELALQHGGESEEAKALKQGVELTRKQFLNVLAKFGVSVVEPGGEQFNPEYHQAMSQKEDDTVPHNTVVEVHQKGYKLKDRLLRPAMVIVSRRQERGDQGAGEEGAREGYDTEEHE